MERTEEKAEAGDEEKNHWHRARGGASSRPSEQSAQTVNTAAVRIVPC